MKKETNFKECYNKCLLLHGLLYCFVLCKVGKNDEEDDEIARIINKKTTPEYQWQEFIISPDVIYSLRPVIVPPFKEPLTYIEYGTNFTATIAAHIDMVAELWRQYNQGLTSEPFQLDPPDGVHEDK